MLCVGLGWCWVLFCLGSAVTQVFLCTCLSLVPAAHTEGGDTHTTTRAHDTNMVTTQGGGHAYGHTDQADTDRRRRWRSRGGKIELSLGVPHVLPTSSKVEDSDDHTITNRMIVDWCVHVCITWFVCCFVPSMSIASRFASRMRTPQRFDLCHRSTHTLTPLSYDHSLVCLFACLFLCQSRTSKLMAYVNWRMRITLSDTRQLVGTFLAFDRHMNLVLADTEEYRKIKQKKGAEEKEEKRTLGLVLLRGECVISLTAEAPPPPKPKAQVLVGGAKTAPGVGVSAGRGVAVAPIGAAPLGLSGPVRGVGGAAGAVMQPQISGAPVNYPAGRGAPMSYPPPPFAAGRGAPPPGAYPPPPGAYPPGAYPPPPFGAGAYPPPPPGAYPPPGGRGYPPPPGAFPQGGR